MFVTDVAMNHTASQPPARHQGREIRNIADWNPDSNLRRARFPRYCDGCSIAQTPETNELQTSIPVSRTATDIQDSSVRVPPPGLESTVAPNAAEIRWPISCGQNPPLRRRSDSTSQIKLDVNTLPNRTARMVELVFERKRRTEFLQSY